MIPAVWIRETFNRHYGEILAKRQRISITSVASMIFASNASIFVLITILIIIESNYTTAKTGIQIDTQSVPATLAFMLSSAFMLITNVLTVLDKTPNYNLRLDIISNTLFIASIIFISIFNGDKIGADLLMLILAGAQFATCAIYVITRLIPNKTVIENEKFSFTHFIRDSNIVNGNISYIIAAIVATGTLAFEQQLVKTLGEGWVARVAIAGKFSGFFVYFAVLVVGKTSISNSGYYISDRDGSLKLSKIAHQIFNKNIYPNFIRFYFPTIIFVSLVSLAILSLGLRGFIYDILMIMPALMLSNISQALYQGNFIIMRSGKIILITIGLINISVFALIINLELKSISIGTVIFFIIATQTLVLVAWECIYRQDFSLSLAKLICSQYKKTLSITTSKTVGKVIYAGDEVHKPAGKTPDNTARTVEDYNYLPSAWGRVYGHGPLTFIKANRVENGRVYFPRVYGVTLRDYLSTTERMSSIYKIFFSLGQEIDFLHEKIASNERLAAKKYKQPGPIVRLLLNNKKSYLKRNIEFHGDLTLANIMVVKNDNNCAHHFVIIDFDPRYSALASSFYSTSLLDTASIIGSIAQFFDTTTHGFIKCILIRKVAAVSFSMGYFRVSSVRALFISTLLSVKFNFHYYKQRYHWMKSALISVVISIA
jgi:hypothetical protein